MICPRLENEMKRLGILALALLMQVLAFAADEISVTLVTLEGEEHAEKLQGVSAAGFKLNRGTVAFADVSELRFGNADAPAAGPTICLRNGDRLKATIASGDDTKLKLKTTALGDFDLENNFLDGIIFPVKDGPAPEAVDAFLKGETPKEDLLLLPKGDTLNGFMEKFTDKELSFNVGGQTRAYAFDQIAAFRLAPLKDWKPDAEFRATLMLRDGSRVTGKLADLKGSKLSFEALNGQMWVVDSTNLQSILFKGGKLAYLSDLKPSAVEEKPYAGGMPVVYTWRRNKSVTGDKLTIGGKSFGYGIGTHSYCKLTYALNGEYAKFLAEVGMDAGGGANAVAAWKVVVDGKDVASGVARISEKSQALKLNVEGARQLELICDYGPDEDDAGDHLDWANARLIKP
jgi:hypothetical protein